MIFLARPNLLFAIDVSGIPYAKTYIGCASFNLKNSDETISLFRKTFKNIKNKKGKDISSKDDLFNIVKFLDQKNIKSTCVVMNVNDWEYNLARVPKEKGYVKERLMGILYFKALNKYSIPDNSYTVHLCNENFMKIDHVISTFNRLSKMHGIEYNIAVSSGKYDDYVKIADYVASATRKIKASRLDQLKYYSIISKVRISDNLLNKAFR